MTFFISIIFILSSYLSIFNVPESHGYNNQGYHLSTLSQELTPFERFQYIFFGILPSRIDYSYKEHCYVIRGKPGYYKNDLRRKKGKKYKAVPRWQYYLNKLSPMGVMESGLDYLMMGKTMLYGGGFNDADEDDFSETSGVDANADGGTDANADGGADGGADANADGGADGGADTNADGGADDGNNDGNNDEKKDDNEDNKEDDKAEDSIDYKEIAKDVLENEATLTAVKAGLLFVPGGSMISSAIDAYTKYRSAEEKLDKLEDKIPGLK